ncbi:thiamine-phosphate kinase [Halobacillus litoralis]|uniref:Thiamine-monophosphate kinase n=1 Tax=Halobacillus litoralis TaxID=45668 RepID=A0A845EIL6_9BACI|nr:thiamine-phosphate kinase [Halobacillus litoralis]MYL51491.1 thiamine-phosphate kinase [Halobacillus litoralis]
MDEFSFIRSIKPDHYRQSSLIKGIDDDAAVFRPSGHDVVTAVDTMVEGVHFTRQTMEPEQIGYRVLAANISDLAAMGSTPAFYMVSITIPSDWTHEELERVYEGMKRLGDSYQMDLIGGDTVSGSELSLSVTVIGMVQKGKARYRSTAEAGDVLFVTGTLGDSRAGLEWLLNPKGQASEDHTYLVQRHQTPVPRVIFASHLSHLERLALNDVSDGIANEAKEIAEASDVDLFIDLKALPFSEPIRNVFPEHYVNWGLSGGEDFELLGCVPEKDWSQVIEAAEHAGVPVSKIGHVKTKEGPVPVVMVNKSGEWERLTSSGYTHLKEKGD